MSSNLLEWLLDPFVKFFLLPLRFVELHICTLEDRRTVAALMFVNNIVSYDIYCSMLLGLINIIVPSRDFQTFVPFPIICRRANYLSNEPIERAQYFFNSLPPSLRSIKGLTG